MSTVVSLAVSLHKQITTKTMLLPIGSWNPFSLEADHQIQDQPTASGHDETKNKYSSSAYSSKGSVGVGLRILMDLSHQLDSHVIVESCTLKRLRRKGTGIHNNPSHELYCSLKSCFLCHKTLSPDKDVYMYRGDQGFCSVDCRSRQMYMDEMREIEAYTKKMLASYRRQQNGGGRCETDTRLGELRQHRHHQRNKTPPTSQHKDRAIFSL